MGYTINDVLTLARAGFTAGQIAAMTAAPTPAVPAPAPAPAVPAAAPAAPAVPAAALAAPTVPAAAPPAPAVPAPAPAQADPLEQILTQLRINALNAAQQPPAQSVDDILAEIINPPAAGK